MRKSVRIKRESETAAIDDSELLIENVEQRWNELRTILEELIERPLASEE